MNEPLTATEIIRRNKDYYDNPSPELQRVYAAIRDLQKKLFLPLIKRTIELIR